MLAGYAPVVARCWKFRKGAGRREIVALLAPVLPRVQLMTLDGMGHMGPITHPERVNAAIEQYLAQALRA